MLAATNIRENMQFAKFAKYNSTPKFVDLQYQAKLLTVCIHNEIIVAIAFFSSLGDSHNVPHLNDSTSSHNVTFML